MWAPTVNCYAMGAVEADCTAYEEPLYVGRAYCKVILTCGKLHCFHNCLYISYDGKGITIEHVSPWKCW